MSSTDQGGGKRRAAICMCAVSHRARLLTVIGECAGRGKLAGTAMKCDDVVCQAEADEQVLTFDIPDHVLEQTATENAFTLFYCTNPSYSCSMPN